MGCIHGKDRIIVKSSIKCDNSPDINEVDNKKQIPKINDDKTDNDIEKIEKQQLKPESPKQSVTCLQVEEQNHEEQKNKEAMNKLKEISLNEVVKSRKFF